jgi:type IV pilus assembly protein PilC
MTTRLFGSAVSGNSSNVSAMSSLTGQLAELLQIGVSRPDAIWIAGHGCENYYFKKAAEQLARDAYSQDRPLSDSPAARTFPANVILALDVGDGRPSIGLLRELSAMYAQRVYRRVDWSTGAVAQISIVLLGAIVAFLVIALFLPLVTLISGLS